MTLSLLLWALIVYGATSIVTVSSIFTSFRQWFYKGYTYNHESKAWEYDNTRPLWLVRILWKLGKLFKCPMCFGFWVGGALSLGWFSPTAYALQGGNVFFDAILGSTICYILHAIMWKIALKDKEDD